MTVSSSRYVDTNTRSRMQTIIEGNQASKNEQNNDQNDQKVTGKRAELAL